MPVYFESGYTLPGADQPLTHARIGHALNWVAGGTITASTTETGYDADAADNSLTYERWKPTALPANWENDFGSAIETDYCLIAGHTLGTNGNRLQIQYDDTGGGVWVDLIDESPTDDEPIFAIFTPTTKQQFRVLVSNGTEPEIAVIKFGAAMQLPQAMYGGHSPLKMARQPVLRSQKTVTGQFAGRSKIALNFATSFAWAHLKASYVRTEWLAFQKALEVEPFGIAWRPSTFSEAGYCWTDQIPVPSNMGIKDYMSVEMPVTGLGHE